MHEDTSAPWHGTHDAAAAANGDESTSGEARAGTQTLLRGLTVLEAIAEQSGPVGVGELSRQIGLPKSTVQRLLRTLAQVGWAESTADPVTRWSLGRRVRALGRRGPHDSDLRDVARPHLQELNDRTGETIHLTVPNGIRSTVLIERLDSPHPVRTYNAIGSIHPIHATAAGKAVLAASADEVIDELLAEPLTKITDKTVADTSMLRHQLSEARRCGYTLNFGENRSQICAIGAAVLDPTNRPVAAISISMPDSRFVAERASMWGSWVAATAQAVSEDFGR